jgi:nitrite reductase/ring-hydroxylating ferredoxin subunit
MPKEHYIASVEELDSEGSSVIAEIEGQEIAVFNIEDEYFAVANYCPHQAGPLCEGDLKGEITLGEDGWELCYGRETLIECPWHSWTFDVQTGRNSADEQYAVPTYEVVVNDNKIYIVM